MESVKAHEIWRFFIGTSSGYTKPGKNRCRSDADETLSTVAIRTWQTSHKTRGRPRTSNDLNGCGC